MIFPDDALADAIHPWSRRGMVDVEDVAELLATWTVCLWLCSNRSCALCDGLGREAYA